MDIFIKLKEVQRRSSLSKTTIYEMMKTGSFPKNIPITIKSVVWIESEIENWMQNRVSASRTPNKAA